MNDAVLQTRSLTKFFGGLVAVKDVSLEFYKGQIHAIIGPNGAGKTTFINLLSGDLTASSGQVTLKGEDITTLPPYKISHRGLGRSYQKTNIFPEFSCLHNCRIAAQSRLPTSMKFFRAAKKYSDVEARALNALKLCGLDHRQDEPPSEISHGERRQLEIGMMLATEPDILLLDEPLAGMGPEEAEAVIDLLKKLTAGHTLVLIEHDMDAVFQVADVLTVMVNGRVLATGTPDAIRGNQDVQNAYLGEDDLGLDLNARGRL